MTEMIVEAEALAATLERLVCTPKVKLVKEGDEIRITPVTYAGKGCPLRGMLAGTGISSYDFMARKREEKELERC